MSLIGISTSILQNKSDLYHLLEFEPDVIEFYNYPKNALPFINEFCSKNSIIPALHVPIPHENKFFKFMPTGPGDELAYEALQMVKTTLEYASDINALHVVVHFPSPIQEGIPEGIKAIERFLDPLANLAQKSGVQVLLENVSPNPDFYSPEDYKKILDIYPILGFCLDIGHAHLLSSSCKVEDFIFAIQDSIKSVHVYNTQVLRYKKHGHEPIFPPKDAKEGWIDINKILCLISEVAFPKAMILEYNALNMENLSKLSSHVGLLKEIINQQIKQEV